MKTQWMIVISMLTIILTSCATSSTSHHAPDLQSFQGRTLPTESAQAAQVANTM